MKFLILFMFTFVYQTNVFAKTFVYCSEGSPSAFNPQITTDGTSNNAAAHTIYNRLIEFKYGSTELIPALASSWTISKDGKEIIFNLRNDVRFHSTKYFTPTRNFNADDVLFSFNRQLDKNHPFHQINGGSYQYWEGMDMSNLIKSIEKLSAYQVRIVLTKAEAPFLANMAMSFMSIISKEYGDQLLAKNTPERIDHYPVGTGPFIFKKYVKDSLIRYTANKNYFNGKPNIDRLVFSITPDANVRYQKLKTNECHLIIEPDPSDIASMKSNNKLIVLETSGLNVSYLAMNTSKAPFNNQLVRKAINHALNRDAYIKAIYRGNAIKAKNPMPPNIWGYDNKAQGYDYSIEKAKKLLTQAGFANGFDVELWTLPVSRPYNPAGKKMGEMMQADLAKVGVKVKLVSYDWPTYLSKSRNGEHQLIQLGWTGDNGDPDNFLHILLGCDGVKAGSNVARWCDKKFNNLITQAKLITEQQKRTKLYIQAQRIFKEAAPWAPIAHSKVFRTMSNKVKGYKLDPLGGDIFTEVDIQ
jgi:dipeptide transport system substrate-binding protein